MPTKSKGFYVLAGVALILIAAIAWAVSTYNGLGSLAIEIEGSQNEIDDLLQRQADLIPQIVSSVRSTGQSGAEAPLKSLGEARARLAAVSANWQKSDAIDSMQTAVDQMYVFGVGSDTLKNDKTYTKLFGMLASDQTLLKSARKKYDEEVLKYNAQLDIFPSNAVAKIFHMGKQQDYETSQAASQARIKLKE